MSKVYKSVWYDTSSEQKETDDIAPCYPQDIRVEKAMIIVLVIAVKKMDKWHSVHFDVTMKMFLDVKCMLIS